MTDSFCFLTLMTSPHLHWCILAFHIEALVKHLKSAAENVNLKIQLPPNCNENYELNLIPQIGSTSYLSKTAAVRLLNVSVIRKKVHYLTNIMINVLNSDCFKLVFECEPVRGVACGVSGHLCPLISRLLQKEEFNTHYHWSAFKM